MSNFINKSLARKVNFFMAFFVLAFSLILCGAIYYDMQRVHDSIHDSNIVLSNNVFAANLESEKKALLQTVVAIKHTPSMVEALKSSDRDVMLAASKPLFDELKSKYGVTHLYFISTDGKCLLRVHKPDDFGDMIQRYTFKTAQKTEKEFVDIEMGKHFFSMRAVTPIYENEVLIGYIEIGREIDHIFKAFKAQTDFDIALLLHTDYVEKYAKIANTTLTPKGGKVGEYIMLNSSNEKLTTAILKQLNSKDDSKKIDGIEINGKVYYCYVDEMQDAFGQKAGELLVVHDHTDMHGNVVKKYGLVIVLSIFILLISTALIRYGISKEILNPLEKIRVGVVSFFSYIRGESERPSYIEGLQSNEIGVIGNTINESMEETVQILEEKKNNEAYFLQQSRVMAIGDMIGNIAHHWRQPLNSIAVTIQDIDVARQFGELDEEYLGKSIKKVLDVTSELSTTIDQLRSFYKPVTVATEFVIEKEVKNVASFFENVVVECGIKIVNEIGGNHKIYGFENEFSQVLINLLLNSKDALTERNTPNPCIWLGEEEVLVNDVKCIKITVSDNAGGTDREVLERIFDPYFTTKHKAQGVGLGLYLSKMAIEKNMNGQMSVKNGEKGLEFSITLATVL